MKKTASSNTSKTISRVEIRICSQANKTLDVTVAHVNFQESTSANKLKNIDYEYNELNELKRENNQVLNKTIVYTYDVGGNLTSKKRISLYNRNTRNPN
ncbi:hypothetical protein [Clostridium grantii]|uniref:YD repeat-containing protein n=1 Tax=Clostridium grantii DSM 8605 TaxID=1121316 RepID=A0A1M5TGE1_9CLOT|nr:hypothetical protein [Clostridium grantii]SHH49720.1 hypothetical protein SAMN02745207_01282 [Clostridium grantii DSM 8605]